LKTEAIREGRHAMTYIENRFRPVHLIILIPILLSILVGIAGTAPVPGLEQFSVAQFVLFSIFAATVAVIFLKYPFLALSAYLYVASWKDIPFLSAFHSLIPTALVIALLLLRSIVQNHSVSSTSQRKHDFWNPSIVVLILFVLYAAVNSIILSDQIGIEKAVRFMTFTLPIYWVVSSLFNSSEVIEKFLLTAMGLGGVFSLVILLSGLSSDISSSRFTGALGFEENRILSGRTAGITLVLGMSYLLFRGQTARLRILASSVILISFGALVYAFSRGAFVSAVLTCVLLLYLRPNRNSITIWIGIGASFISILMSSSFVMGSLLRVFTNRFSNLLDVSTLDRLEYYRTGIDSFFTNPVWGVGLGNFYAYSLLYQVTSRTYAHNLIIEVFSETGLIGGILFFFPLVYTLSMGAKIVKRPMNFINPNVFAPVTCFAAFIFFSLSAMFSGDIQVNRYLWLFAFLVWQLSKQNSVPLLQEIRGTKKANLCG
jgi:O-antigen ligase